MKPVNRFSDRVSYYAKHRPGYPQGIIPLLEREIGFDFQKDVADIGSGTGNLSRLFLSNDNLVFGVEPNDKMRSAAEHILRDYLNFVSIKGTAENSTLADESVDVITSGQAFHWFDTDLCKKEFLRILRPGGCVVITWNERNSDISDFMEEYETLLNNFGAEYKDVCPEKFDEKICNKFFGVRNFKLAKFENHQIFDYEGLKGRLLSSSYIPLEGAVNKKMLVQLKKIYLKYNKGNHIKFDYTTKVYFGRIKKV